MDDPDLIPISEFHRVGWPREGGRFVNPDQSLRLPKYLTNPTYLRSLALAAAAEIRELAEHMDPAYRPALLDVLDDLEFQASIFCGQSNNLSRSDAMREHHERNPVNRERDAFIAFYLQCEETGMSPRKASSATRAAFKRVAGSTADDWVRRARANRLAHRESTGK